MIRLASTLLLPILLGIAPSISQLPRATVESMGWLAGCWEGEIRGGKNQEQWMRPEGKSMLGMSRTIVNGETVLFEFLQIVQERDELQYVARPQGKEPTSFRLIRGGDHQAVFENPEHDFPQRIVYSLRTDGSLAARIEGTDKGKERFVDFQMRRVKCD